MKGNLLYEACFLTLSNDVSLTFSTVIACLTESAMLKQQWQLTN